MSRRSRSARMRRPRATSITSEVLAPPTRARASSALARSRVIVTFCFAIPLILPNGRSLDPSSQTRRGVRLGWGCDRLGATTPDRARPGGCRLFFVEFPVGPRRDVEGGHHGVVGSAEYSGHELRVP